MKLNLTAFALLLSSAVAIVPAMAQNRPAPSLSAAPVVTDAPGSGIQSGGSGHSAVLPVLYQLDQQPIEQISPLVQRQYLVGAQSTFVKWIVKKGGVFPLHHHANEQITWITEGRCEVSSQGKKFIMTAGTVMVIPPNTPHEFVCTEDTIDIDFFSPQRQDWIDGVPSIAASPK
ncbi:quercetin dioxygenase-like cupin family protein [Bradyrhizobium japonicum]|uniref:cupin domain-containing protein n=1 Tax=Bradyrhizobium japonicum TaxID=375 RepID=UPI001BADDEE8|nr:cupin domain-containing protein [Bradyrhizobium japonicum]MBR0913082.1 cupin domain-containing protein [Bradyrhizobium japonicum]